MLSRFFDDTRGSIAAIFAMSLVPVLGLISLAIDYGRASHVETTLQRAADAGAMACQRLFTQDRDKIHQTFSANFRANLPDDFKDTPFELKVASDFTRMTVKTKREVPTTMLAMIGRKQLTVGAETTVRLPQSATREPSQRPAREPGSHSLARKPIPRPQPSDAQAMKEQMLRELDAAVASGQIDRQTAAMMRQVLSQMR